MAWNALENKNMNSQSGSSLRIDVLIDCAKNWNGKNGETVIKSI